MKKILLAISSLFLVACSEYTVKVDVSGVKINGEEVKEGSCVSYDYTFFGFGGDFPIKIKVGEEKAKEYEAEDWIVSSSGVDAADEACKEVTEEETEKEVTKKEEETEKVIRRRRN